MCGVPEQGVQQQQLPLHAQHLQSNPQMLPSPAAHGSPSEGVIHLSVLPLQSGAPEEMQSCSSCFQESGTSSKLDPAWRWRSTKVLTTTWVDQLQTAVQGSAGRHSDQHFGCVVTEAVSMDAFASDCYRCSALYVSEQTIDLLTGLLNLLRDCKI